MNYMKILTRTLFSQQNRYDFLEGKTLQNQILMDRNRFEMNAS